MRDDDARNGARFRRTLLTAALALTLVAGCRVLPFERTEDREPCADYDPLRRPLFGDLHVHTELSWDAYAWDVRFGPEDAYRFARGEALDLTFDPGVATGRRLRLDRPLDFAGVTDHGEYLGEVRACTDPSYPAFDEGRCATFRQGGDAAGASLGVTLLTDAPVRFQDLCGRGGIDCLAIARDVWREVREAAEAAYDRTESCAFTTFIAYEYTGTNDINGLHRNVIFRNDEVLDAPVSHFEAPAAEQLWSRLQTDCIEAGDRCDVLSIAHNPNLSNGAYYDLSDLPSGAAGRRRAALRAEMEPLLEIFQHKGDSECRNGLSGLPDDDPLCRFEKFEAPGSEDCGEGTGVGGPVGAGLGCRSYRDYARGALVRGLEEDARIGVNPLPFGILAGTDTHSAIPGAVDEESWKGHRGNLDDEAAEKLLAPGRDAGIVANPGGLSAVWAEERSRDAIFAALRRKETFGTSGPRIAVRLFGAWGLPAGICDAPDLVEQGYSRGVPMGGTLPPRVADAPSFVVSALRDPEGTPLQRIQIVKGWVDPDGTRGVRVHAVAGDPENGASVDLVTCATSGRGADALCGRWTDPDFDPDAHAYYYARVVENPTCRWSTRLCNSLPASRRPASCDDPRVPDTIQERAWTSPIFYRP